MWKWVMISESFYDVEYLEIDGFPEVANTTSYISESIQLNNVTNLVIFQE